MSEENRRLAIRWFEEVWNTRREAIIDEVMSPDSLGHMEGAEIVGPLGFKSARTALLTAFPDFRVVVEATAADGESVVVRWKATGTHRGAGFGIQPTDRQVEFRGMTWFQIRAGRVVEGLDSWNLGALVEYLRTPL